MSRFANTNGISSRSLRAIGKPSIPLYRAAGHNQPGFEDLPPGQFLTAGIGLLAANVNREPAGSSTLPSFPIKANCLLASVNSTRCDSPGWSIIF